MYLSWKIIKTYCLLVQQIALLFEKSHQLLDVG